MTEEEFDRVTEIENISQYITIEDLKASDIPTGRILYGFTFDRHGFAVYFDGYEIRVIIEYSDGEVEEVVCGERVQCNDCVPKKRVYPQHTNFEFCKLLIERGQYIPFTTYPKPPRTK